MKLDPRHLEILAAIVDNGGLSEGARALAKSQPSVSRSVAMLEERIGLRLFEPGRKPLQPTALCIRLAEEGRRVHEAGQAASRVIRQHRSGETGAVRIAGTPIFMDGVVSGIIAAFQSAFPDVRIDQTYGYPAEVLSLLREGALDLGFVPIRAAEVLDGLAFHQLLHGRNVIACRVGHPLARQASVALADVARYPWIAPPADSPLFHDLRAVLEGIGEKNFKVSFSGGSLSSIVNLLTGSDTLTVLPFSVVYMQRSQRTITALGIRIGDPDRHLGVVHRTGLPQNSASHHLADFVSREFQSLAEAIARHGKTETA